MNEYSSIFYSFFVFCFWYYCLAGVLTIHKGNTIRDDLRSITLIATLLTILVLKGCGIVAIAYILGVAKAASLRLLHLRTAIGLGRPITGRGGHSKLLNFNKIRLVCDTVSLDFFRSIFFWGLQRITHIQRIAVIWVDMSWYDLISKKKLNGKNPERPYHKQVVSYPILIVPNE